MQSQVGKFCDGNPERTVARETVCCAIVFNPTGRNSPRPPTPTTMPLPERNLTRLDLAQTSYSTNNQSARLNFSWNRSSRRQLYIIFDSAIMNDIHAIPLLRDPSISLSTALSTTHDLYMRERRDKSLKVKENKDSLVY